MICFRTTVDHERRPDGVFRAAEHGLPEAMTDQDQRLPLGRFLAREAASQQRLNAEEWKQVGRDAGAGDAVRALRSRQRHRHGIEGGDVREGLSLGPPLFDVLKRRSALAERSVPGPQSTTSPTVPATDTEWVGAARFSRR